MKTILFVGDDDAMRETCRREMEDEGFRVMFARDAAQAVSLWRSERPDVVILDNLMPRKGALRAAEEIGALDPAAAVILYMGYDDTYVQDPRTRFLIACVEKSRDFAELKRAISRALTPRGDRNSLRSGLPPE